MIYIAIDKAINIPGYISVFIYNNNEKIKEVVEKYDLCEYHKDTLLFELPLISLSSIMDELCYIDEIQIIIKDDGEQRVVEQPLLNTPKLKPFKHQVDAVQYGLTHNNWLLLDDPGLGKTYSVTMLAEELYKRGLINHCLIICGLASLRQNWKREIKANSNLSCMINGEHITKTGNISYKTIEERCEELSKPIDEFFIITNIESYRVPKKDSKRKIHNIIKPLLNGPNKCDLIIFDECHKAKGYDTQSAKGLLKLKSKYKVAMSGTLIPNNPLDAYFPLAWLGIEKPRNITRFKKLYCIEDPEIKGSIIGFKNLELLQEELNLNSLRRTKEDMYELLSPEARENYKKIVFNEYIELNEEHRKLYDLVENATAAEFKKEAKEQLNLINVNTPLEFTVLLRLRQAAILPDIVTTKPIVSSKLERAIDLARQIVANGNKVVILSNFKAPLERLNIDLADLNPFLVTGDTDETEVVKAMNQFQDDDIHKVWLGTHDKCGTGLSLNRASYMIVLDDQWSPAYFDQSTDRILRINNKAPAFIYNLVAVNTIDEVMLAVLNKKRAISKYLVDQDNSDKVKNIVINYLQQLKK